MKKMAVFFLVLSFGLSSCKSNDKSKSKSNSSKPNAKKAISLGLERSCAVLENGEVKCWGSNDYGRLGTGNTNNLNTPSAPIDLGGKAKAISLGGMHSCAVLENEGLKCWGENYHGQLGTGDYTNLNIPSAAINLEGKAVAISLGEAHSCALLESGDVKCWGENFYGQLGNGKSVFPRNETSPVSVTFD